MPTSVVIGAQWGDEGKGKIVDILAERAEMVVRFQGGNNAGHTLVIDGEKTVLHHIPSGILRAETACVLASGVVVDPGVCLAEIDGLRARGFLDDPAQLTIGTECSVIMPYHQQIDVAREAAVHGTRIGTTGRGIGPCYEDRVGRRSVLVRDLLEPEVLLEKISANLIEKNAILRELGESPLDAETIADQFAGLGEQLAPYVRESNRRVRDAVTAGRNVLFEGAQGTMLDVGLGTYPFVTSSHTVSAALCVGTGVSPGEIDEVFGITKAYCTRVGEGPFPTELHDDTGQFLRDAGAEYGSTTGRPRRCGWLDGPALRFAARINGMTKLAVTKLDVLSGLDTIRLATAYRDPVTGDELDEPPADWRVLDRLEPVWRSFDGWTEDITAVTRFDGLPANAKAYVEALEELVGVPVGIVSVGPGRRATFEH